MEDLQHALQRAAFARDDAEPTRARSKARRALGPVVIEVRELEKSFRIPRQGGKDRELRALRGISFDVRQGEFFGVVGRNGSGKSTLLKILSSIYQADAGRIRIGGRLAPFIELGVGFNPELTARENVALNGVMMGLGRREAARRLDSVLDFAGLGEFVDLKLKNYSSGMTVRLAFAVMVEADADIMLVDEVLAVGDAAFAQKCMDVFEAKRKAGKTLVLVTHNMAIVQSFCDRAMLLHDGDLRYIGDPEETTLRYYRLNFGGSHGADGGSAPDVKLLDVWLENDAGERVENVEQGQPIGLNLVIEARRELFGPLVRFEFLNVDGVPVFGFSETLSEPERIPAGRRVRIAAKVENPLVPGRYSIDCSVLRDGTQGNLGMRVPGLVDFLVRGRDPIPGMVSVRTEVDAVLEP